MTDRADAADGTISQHDDAEGTTAENTENCHLEIEQQVVLGVTDASPRTVEPDMCSQIRLSTSKPVDPDVNTESESDLTASVLECVGTVLVPWLDRYITAKCSSSTDQCSALLKKDPVGLDVGVNTLPGKHQNEELVIHSFEEFYEGDGEPFVELFKESEADGVGILPCFQVLFDGESDADTCETPAYTGLANNSFFTNVPEVEELQDTRDDYFDRSVLDLLQEVKDEIAHISAAKDPGTSSLSDRQCSEQNGRNKKGPVISKTAKKRKKQQQKLQKLAAQQQSSENRGRRFAQSYEELKKTRISFDLDKDIEPLLSCPVCLEMYHLPSTCHPCGHMFCDLCLRRLTTKGSEGVPCPLCRTVITSCELDRDFDEQLILLHPEIYTARAVSERRSKYRHYPLPYTPPVPLAKRFMRQLAAARNSQSDGLWMSHDWFKFLLGCTAGMCLSLLIMLLNHVKSLHDVRDVNIAFLSILVGASVTYVTFKYMKI